MQGEVQRPQGEGPGDVPARLAIQGEAVGGGECLLTVGVLQGPDWQFETRLPCWAEEDWHQPPQEMK